VIRARSIAAFRGELERAIAINADYLVMHPGNYKGQELEEGIIAIMYGLIEAASGSRAPPCESCSKIRRAPEPPSAAGSKNWWSSGNSCNRKSA